MSRIKYYYDTEKCKYEKIEPKIGNILLSIFGFLFTAFVFGVGLVFLYDHFYDFPGEENLKSEVKSQKLKNHTLDQLLIDFQKDLDDLKSDEIDLRILVGADSSIRVSSDHIRKLTSREIDQLLDGDEKTIDLISTEYLDSIVSLKTQIEQLSASYVYFTHLTSSKQDRLASIPWITPIGKDQKYRVASGYGMRKHPVLGIRKMHTGVDYACKIGTPIRATGNGVVKRIKKSCCKGYGNMVDIDHGYGFVTRYAHMSKILVKKGQKIKRGDVIGEVGSTGTSTGPHLHYEVIKNGKKNNPVLFVHDLSDEEYEEMLRIAALENEALSIPEEE